ncbi:MAG TPA: hypothetical protein VMU93_16845 [Caulobacteraceae bacterium]|nr:hypothetical protein [Caulobacteraceae bacterium]
MTPWEAFFAAEVGASAALTGLVVVAISVNLARTLATAGLPARAAEALIVLTSALLLASAVLIPFQPEVILGAEIAAVGFLSLGGTLAARRRSRRSQVASLAPRLLHAILDLAAAAPMVVAGVLVAEGRATGLYWAAGGVVAALATGILSAWLLLIEISR